MSGKNGRNQTKHGKYRFLKQLTYKDLFVAEYNQIAAAKRPRNN